LDESVAVLKKYEGLRLRIEGHTDNRGSAELNHKLSHDRANSVRDYLISKGIASERLEAEGYGDTKPSKPNSTAAGRAATRRIEFIPIGAQ
jgi:outer membrane protein OmpA-like peptidoglycan-associated protein